MNLVVEFESHYEVVTDSEKVDADRAGVVAAFDEWEVFKHATGTLRVIVFGDHIVAKIESSDASGAFQGRTSRDVFQAAADSLSGHLHLEALKRQGFPKPCPLCSSLDFVWLRGPAAAFVEIEGFTRRAEVAVGAPGATSALVCENCGRVEWFATEPKRLVDHFGGKRIRAAPAHPYR